MYGTSIARLSLLEFESLEKRVPASKLTCYYDAVESKSQKLFERHEDLWKTALAL